jgi:hypothetical protein
MRPVQSPHFPWREPKQKVLRKALCVALYLLVEALRGDVIKSRELGIE